MHQGFSTDTDCFCGKRKGLQNDRNSQSGNKLYASFRDVAVQEKVNESLKDQRWTVVKGIEVGLRDGWFRICPLCILPLLLVCSIDLRTGLAAAVVVVPCTTVAVYTRVAREVEIAQRIISNISVQVPTLRVSSFLIGKRCVSRHEPSQARRAVSSPEVVEPRFRITFFAGELVVLGHIRAVVVFHPAIRIVVNVLFADGCRRILNHAVRSQVVREVGNWGQGNWGQTGRSLIFVTRKRGHYRLSPVFSQFSPCPQFSPPN